MSIKLEHIPTKSRKYEKFFYNTKTVRVSLFPQRYYVLLKNHFLITHLFSCILSCIDLKLSTPKIDYQYLSNDIFCLLSE